MKYKKIKKGLIDNCNWGEDIDVSDEEMIRDVNEVVSNYYKTKLDIQAELYHKSLDEKNKELVDSDRTIKALQEKLVDQEIETKELRNLALKYDQTNADLRKELADKEKVYQISIDMISAQLKHEIERGKLIQSFFDKTNPIHKL